MQTQLSHYANKTRPIKRHPPSARRPQVNAPKFDSFESSMIAATGCYCGGIDFIRQVFRSQKWAIYPAVIRKFPQRTLALATG